MAAHAAYEEVGTRLSTKRHVPSRRSKRSWYRPLTMGCASESIICDVPCTRPALSTGVRTGGDGRESDRWQVGGGPGAIDFSLDCVCRTTG